MRRLSELPVLVILLAFAALAMLLPAGHAMVNADYRIARSFFYAAVLFLFLTAMIAIATANRRPRNLARSQLAAVVMAYVVLPPVLAVPFHHAVQNTTFMNAWFEMLSCFTTTGATVYDDPARLAGSLHLWRALVGWLGGFFVLLSAIAVLAPLNLGGFEVMSGGSLGRATPGTQQITRIADPSERIVRHALELFPVYGGLTLLLWILLLTAGETGITALSHAMSTLSTSGVSPQRELSEAQSGRLGELMIFLFFAFAISRRALFTRLPARFDLPLWRDPEVRMALVCIAMLPLFQFLQHWTGRYEDDQSRDVLGALRALWGTLFTTLSFLTTTGFVSEDWQAARLWAGPGSSGLVLVGLALIGGGVATAAGGVKLLRVYALFKHGQHELDRMILPHVVGGEGPVARRLRGEGAYVAWIFFMLFAMSIAVTMALLTMSGLEFEPAMIFTVAALSTTGPLAQVGADAPLSYALLDPEAKLILAAAMIVGRLETLAILALLIPDNWRR
ncbi:TrkH family potassium uptake protein [Tabrizicola sp. J26]|uniref:TrkH family potassium uptake protein n=1 Tax=Alitabrizicola rongguiensis TaxID=2909234 RepID=UPI001F1C15CF|nr:potassium transporter TrkG [Tabrizicola rongguiensis]MCF1709820.1 TrkH family potassium uptake protein [Tabrizicola rongguiensis]